jgi:hypothetical protein
VTRTWCATAGFRADGDKELASNVDSSRCLGGATLKSLKDMATDTSIRRRNKRLLNLHRTSGAWAVSQEPSSATETIELAAELTAAWLANPNTRASSEDVPAS